MPRPPVTVRRLEAGLPADLRAIRALGQRTENAKPEIQDKSEGSKFRGSQELQHPVAGLLSSQSTAQPSDILHPLGSPTVRTPVQTLPIVGRGAAVCWGTGRCGHEAALGCARPIPAA